MRRANAGWAAVLLLPAVALASDAGTETWVGEQGNVPVTFATNQPAYAQLPGQTTAFLGRLRFDAGPAGTGQFGVLNYAMDWDHDYLADGGFAFWPFQKVVGGAEVINAYDPTIASWGGQLWAAFECASAKTTSAATCIGPYDPATGKIDPTRTTIVADGRPMGVDAGLMYSASTPKLLVFHGLLYLYWTVVTQLTDGGSPAVQVHTRGAQLEESAGVLHIAGTTTTISAIDPSHSVEVWGLAGDDESNVTADVQGVFTDGVSVFAIGALGGNAGGNTCTAPNAFRDAGCYRMDIARSTTPLGREIFQNGDRLPESELVSNTQSYTRMIVLPDGGRDLMGAFRKTPGFQLHPVEGVFQRFPIPADWQYFATPPAPTGVARKIVPSEALFGMDGACQIGLNQSCDTGASRLCRQSYGNYAAGFGPVQIGGNGTSAIVCLGADVATRENATFQQLSAAMSGCNGLAAIGSIDCHAAVDRWCQDAGFASGLSIEEASASGASFACVKAAAAKRISEPWSTLTNAFSGCTSASQGQGFVCLPAADDLCSSKKLGYVSGFGTQEISASGGQILCLGPPAAGSGTGDK
jgi:hypothetical protein